MSVVYDTSYAFPRSSASFGAQTGMSMRDYFAGQALAGLLAGLTSADNRELMKRGMTSAEIDLMLAKGAYQLAGAMLTIRDNQE